MITMGYPQMDTTAEEVDRLYEAESARLWEELNGTEEAEVEIDPYPAFFRMGDAQSHINKAVSKLHDAAETVKGTPYEHRIESLAMALEEVYSYIENEVAYIKKEECF